MPEPAKPKNLSRPAEHLEMDRDTSDQQHSSADTSPSDAAAAHAQETAPDAGSTSSGSLVGKTFDDFELLEEVGRGGMGVVYKARQRSLDRLVALKMLHAETFQSPASLARFQAEARAIAALRHPNIVSVFQVGECPAGHYFAMEFLQGQSLLTILSKGPMPVHGAVTLLIAVASALHYAHSKGVIHRDLKPANIMIDEFRRPIVTDFGIAKVEKSPSLTKEGVIIGTPGYMAPEQAEESMGTVGPHSDVYSLGAIFYSALTARPPFEEGSTLRTIMKVVSPDSPPDVRSLRPEVPLELGRICMKCLKKRPADRYPTAQALAEDLRRFRVTHSAEKDRTRVPAGLPSLVLVSLETGKEIRVSKPTTVIGRGSECDLVLRASDVSRRHCQIVLNSDGVMVEDLTSGNGTFVNGLAVERAVLGDGDKLHIARHAFQIRLH